MSNIWYDTISDINEISFDDSIHIKIVKDLVPGDVLKKDNSYFLVVKLVAHERLRTALIYTHCAHTNKLSVTLINRESKVGVAVLAEVNDV